MISVANGKRTGGGFYLAPNAQLDDGLFDINLIGKIHPINRLIYLPVIEKGKHTGLSFVQHFQTNTIDIVSAVPLHAHVDGEYFTGHHFAITCLPGRFIFLV